MAVRIMLAPEMSFSTTSTPEFSGRTMMPKRAIAAPEPKLTVTRVHFIVTGPAATRC
jgi:hypothetical protein